MLILIFAYKLGIDVIPFYTGTSGDEAPPTFSLSVNLQHINSACQRCITVKARGKSSLFAY